jgi:predicted dehydrogenase
VNKLRTAVVGVGYVGRFHAQKHRALDGVELVAVCDRDAQRCRNVAAEVGTRATQDARELIGSVDAVTIAATTAEHFALARYFLEHDVHVLVEKPLARTSAEAAILTRLAAEHRVKLQVGHVERFNPALLAARRTLNAVRFIECHRLAPFKGRGNDVNVVLDVMIHDLDLILSLVDSRPVSVSAVGIPVLMDEVDIANARIEFANGAIANVTASRVSATPQQRFRVFQANQYLSIDFGSAEVRRVTKNGSTPDTARLREESWRLDKGDMLLAETQAFIDAIVADTPCLVSGADAQACLELAEMIGADIARRRGH